MSGDRLVLAWMIRGENHRSGATSHGLEQASSARTQTSEGAVDAEAVGLRGCRAMGSQVHTFPWNGFQTHPQRQTGGGRADFQSQGRAGCALDRRLDRLPHGGRPPPPSNESALPTHRTPPGTPLQCARKDVYGWMETGPSSASTRRPKEKPITPKRSCVQWSRRPRVPTQSFSSQKAEYLLIRVDLCSYQLYQTRSKDSNPLPALSEPVGLPSPPKIGRCVVYTFAPTAQSFPSRLKPLR